MGLLTKIFGAKNRQVETKLGEFLLVYNKKHKKLWTCNIKEIELTVRGSEYTPDDAFLNYAESIEKRIEKLSEEITKKFKVEFSNAELDIKINKWTEKFKIVAIEIIMIVENDSLWSITFEDLETPYYHFTIFIENDNINQDFAIDS